jgi:hypothetical protein
MKIDREIKLETILVGMLHLAMIGLMSWATLHFVTRDEFVKYQSAQSQLISAVSEAVQNQKETLILLKAQSPVITDHEARLRAIENRQYRSGASGFGSNNVDSVSARWPTPGLGRIQ